MSKTATSETDDNREQEDSWSLFITILLIISIALSALFILSIVVSIFISVSTVGWWPLVKGWTANPAIKWMIALSFLSFGVVLFQIKSNYPRVFMILETIFAITLAWVALGESDANRLTVSLAILATAFATADIFKGLKSSGETKTKKDPFEPRFGFDLNSIRVYQGEKLVCTIPKGIAGAAYKIDLEKLEQRIKDLEDRTG
ncbi:hypothetical protein [Sedimenticola sp.]|uniref:hypothetical protein n=1 Tax=Sedimenticola sp. TaxID=1940285 RepID=UPI003D141840